MTYLESQVSIWRPMNWHRIEQSDIFGIGGTIGTTIMLEWPIGFRAVVLCTTNVWTGLDVTTAIAGRDVHALVLAMNGATPNMTANQLAAKRWVTVMGAGIATVRARWPTFSIHNKNGKCLSKLHLLCHHFSSLKFEFSINFLVKNKKKSTICITLFYQ